MTFTVELKNGRSDLSRQIEIYVDELGLRDLKRQLEFLRRPGDDLHFFTAAWGGQPLQEATHGDGAETINHMKITLVEGQKLGRPV